MATSCPGTSAGHPITMHQAALGAITVALTYRATALEKSCCFPRGPVQKIVRLPIFIL